MALPADDHAGDEPGPDEGGTQRIPLAEERVRIATRETVRGTLRVQLTTEEVEETLRATLRGRRATVERVPIGREVDEAPKVRQEGDVVIVPVVEEVLVVERRLRLTEELHLRLEPVEEEVEVPVRRRVQHAGISRHDAPPDAPPDEIPDPDPSHPETPR